MSIKRKDKLTPDMLNGMPLEKQVSLLNRRIHFYLQTNNHQKNLRFDEKHILNDATFQMLIHNARERLGVTDFYDFNEYQQTPGAVNEWLTQQVVGQNRTEDSDEYHTCFEKVTKEVAEIIEKENLPTGWFDYVAAYIALGEKPVYTDIERDPLIYVEDIEHDDLVIKMERGLKQEDYVAAWKALKPFLNQTNRQTPSRDTLKNRIYTDRKKGLSIVEISKKYMPEAYKNDPLATKDKIKKIITRFKH